MVGDNLEWDVAAPQKLGIFGVWIDRHAQGLPAGTTVAPDGIVRSLAEVLLVPRFGRTRPLVV
jgi:putative hydrolase of the HAD superfamily